MGRRILATLPFLLVNILLFIVVILFGMFAFNFISINSYLLSIIGLSKFTSGWSAFLITFYGLMQIAIYIIYILLIVEIGCLVLRLLLSNFYHAFDAYRNQPYHSRKYVKMITLITVFKKIGINTKTKALISYLFVALIVIGGSFVTKKIMEKSDDVVYRAYAKINLKREETPKEALDMSDVIEAKEAITVDVKMGIGSLYIIKQGQVNGKVREYITIYYNYDNQEQLDTYSYNFDVNTSELKINAVLDNTSYEKYEEAVMPTVLIIFPANLTIDKVNFETNQGDFELTETTIGDVFIKTNDSVIRFDQATKKEINNLSIAGNNLDVNLDEMYINEKFTCQIKNGILRLDKGTYHDVDINIDNVKFTINTVNAENSLIEMVNTNVIISNYYAKNMTFNVNSSDLQMNNYQDSSYVYEKVLVNHQNSKIKISGLKFEEKRVD